MGQNLNETVGALLLGSLFTAVGYGITTMQTYMYMTRFPKDPKIMRYTVWSLLILDTTHITLSWHMVYYYLILNYDNPPALERSVWSFDITVVVTAVITVVAHCFYARRVFILGGRQWFLTIIILCLSAMRLIFGTIVTVRLFQIRELALVPHKIGVEVGVGMGAGTLADFIITVSLVWFLRGHRSGFNSQTDNLLDRIIFWTINNGLLTSIVGLVVILTCIIMPYNMIYLAVHLLLSKLYANALLATLNFRKSHRGRGLDDEDTTIQLSGMSRGRRTESGLQFSGKDSTTAPVVHVVTTTTTDMQFEGMSKVGSHSDIDFDREESIHPLGGLKEDA
ncbi:hypothetical protein BKA93DRAFT_827718 [Sparassis latifolia]|uniref:DUF6534 domain-containing protein n=1 Tax=Sparassis crispa TaxID=139825 RepID=A0A401GQT0_9APHY|nr:hypothetical protein SCP_0605520 [Sparassis crispa]GBE84573.1 hypothetical protein SCP_0605520 [Sparassis crispa]